MNDRRTRRPPRAYRVLLALLPRRLRERHGRAMAGSFAEALVAARETAGAAVVRVWLRGATDVVWRAIYERVRRRGDVLSPHLASTLPADMRFAFRGFMRHPGMTLLSVLMLSLGVGACVAVFSMVDGLFFRPLPFPEPDRLVYVNETAPRWNTKYTAVNHAHHAVWRDRVRAFEAIGIFRNFNLNLVVGGGVERVMGAQVTYDLAAALGVEPVLGRTFTPEEDSPSGPPAVMLGYDLWQTRFGGRRDVLGETIRLSGDARTVVGVLPPEAEFPGGIKLWVPLARDPNNLDQGYSFDGVGRLKPGVKLTEAQLDLERAHAPIWAELDTARIVSPIVVPLREELASNFAVVGVALAAAVALVLLIACGNVASILLARSFARQRELSIRLALGASAGRIARQLFAESVALALVAGPLGLVLGFAAVRGLFRVLPAELPSWISLAVDWRTGLFGLALVAVTTVIFGWAPLVQARRRDARDALAEGGRTSVSRRQRRMLNGLVVVEVTLAALLLVASGLLLRTFQQLRHVDPGFRTEGVLTFTLALADAPYPDSASLMTFSNALVRELEALPGTRAAGLVNCAPMGCHWGWFFHVVGAPARGRDENRTIVLARLATPGYFDAAGIRLVRGRFLEPVDQQAVVINESFARLFFPGVEDPTGRQIALGRDPPEGVEEHPFTVVGVVKDVMHYGMDEPMRPGVYIDQAFIPLNKMTVALWTAADLETAATLARGVVERLDPELPLYDVRTTEQLVHGSLTVRRAYSYVIAAFASMALLLALGGIYGVLSYLVGQRGHEIGIRMALGATGGNVVRMVVQQGVALVLVGAIPGFGVALLMGDVGSGLLAGLSPRDPATFAGAAALLTITTLLATLAPAARAVGVEPQSALREE